MEARVESDNVWDDRKEADSSVLHQLQNELGDSNWVLLFRIVLGCDALMEQEERRLLQQFYFTREGIQAGMVKRQEFCNNLAAAKSALQHYLRTNMALAAKTPTSCYEQFRELKPAQKKELCALCVSFFKWGIEDLSMACRNAGQMGIKVALEVLVKG